MQCLSDTNIYNNRKICLFIRLYAIPLVCVCVYASSFATAIVLLSKLSGREGNLNVYLTWLWLIPNWAYSTLLPFLCLCVYFIHHALFSLSYAPRWLYRRTMHHFLVEGEATTCLQLQDIWRKLISFCSLCI